MVALNGQIDCVTELLAAGAQINKRSINGQTALFLDVDNGHAVCVKELLKADTDLHINETASMGASLIQERM